MRHCQYCTCAANCSLLGRCQKEPEPVASPLHRPVVYGDEVMKGGLQQPDPRPVDQIPVNPRPTGWICPKCQKSNAPNQPTCFHCAMREGATS